MPENKKESFTVTDRRLFTTDGELRKDVAEEEQTQAQTDAATKSVSSTSATQNHAHAESGKQSPAQTSPIEENVGPQPPTDAEQQQQANAYQKSSAEMDRQAELSGVSAKDMEITFERFLASLYMTGMLQLGLMHEQGMPPQVDLIGARQTIDTISLLSDKTKGNLTPKEQNFLQNALYELRMAYVEVTNAIAKSAQKVPAAK